MRMDLPTAGRAWNARNTLVKASAVRKFHHDGFVEIDVDPTFLFQRVQVIKDGLARMTNGDDKEAFTSVVLFKDEMGDDHDSGLIRRYEDEQKWFFHVYPETRGYYRRHGAPVDRYDAFFTAMEEVTSVGFELAKEFAKLWDLTHRPPFSVYEKVQAACAVTRALRYLKRKSNQLDAKLHFDRCGITNHWWSSEPGLFLIKPDGEKVTVAETAVDRISLFPGRKWAAVTNGSFGSGTPHGVKDVNRDAAGRDDRYALVTFVHIALTQREAAWLRARAKAFDALIESCIV